MAADGVLAQRLTEVRVGGGALAVDLRPLVTRCRVSTSLTQSSQLQLEIADPRLERLRAGLFAKGTPVTYAGLELVVRVRAITERSSGPQLSITARSAVVSKMKASSGARTWSSTSPDAVVRERVVAQGGVFVGEPRPKRRSIVRRGAKDGQKAEDDWALAERLASEEGAIRFDVGKRVFWGRPTWLAANLPRKALAWRPPGEGDSTVGLLGVPALRDSDDDDRVQISGQLSLLWSVVAEHGPGVALDVTGVGDLSGRFLSAGASWDVLENEGTVDVESPVDPEATKQVDETPTKKAAAKK